MSDIPEIDCEGTDQIICPHCGFEHTDSYESMSAEPRDGDKHNTECGSCEKPFMVRLNVTYDWDSRKPLHEWYSATRDRMNGKGEYYRIECWCCDHCGTEIEEGGPETKPPVEGCRVKE